MLTEIQAQIEQHNARNNKLCHENANLTDKLESLMNQCELREQVKGRGGKGQRSTTDMNNTNSYLDMTRVSKQVNNWLLSFFKSVACWKYCLPWLSLSEVSLSASCLFWLVEIDADVLLFLPPACQRPSTTRSAATSLIVSLDNVSRFICQRSLTSRLVGSNCCPVKNNCNYWYYPNN